MFARIALALTVTTVLALVACGDDGPPSAAEIYANTGEAMAALTSYHVTGDGLDDGEAFTIELDLVLPDRYQSAFTFSEVDNDLRVNFIGIDDVLYQQYVDISSDWFIASEEDRAEIGDNLAFAAALTTKISDLTYIGEEDLDGVATYHLEGMLAREVLELVELDDALLPESVPVELWIGKDDSLVRRYVLSPDEADQRTTFTLSRFNDESISVEAPPDPLPAEEFEIQLIQQGIADLTVEERECLISVFGEDTFAELEAGERLLTDEEGAAGEVCFPE